MLSIHYPSFPRHPRLPFTLRLSIHICDVTAVRSLSRSSAPYRLWSRFRLLQSRPPTHIPFSAPSLSAAPAFTLLRTFSLPLKLSHTPRLTAYAFLLSSNISHCTRVTSSARLRNCLRHPHPARSLVSTASDQSHKTRQIV